MHIRCGGIHCVEFDGLELTGVSVLGYLRGGVEVLELDEFGAVVELGVVDDDELDLTEFEVLGWVGLLGEVAELELFGLVELVGPV